ncbi:unnamed protein product [Leptidea sinapis]|uniref:Peroxin-19 n=1 Tax=Leptidea sinapis TaxID=189913 RepID=A0A5E4QY52_9NEOP|nr:unnamed protein product [Leptidea sinapis]
MSENKEETSKEIDPELDELLDSALQDMLKSRKQEKPEPAENMWSEEFIKEAAAQFESNMAAIMGGFSGMPEDQITQEQIAQTFTKMAGSASVSSRVLRQVSAAISQTLQSLNSNTEALKTPFSEQDLAGMHDAVPAVQGGAVPLAEGPGGKVPRLMTKVCSELEPEQESDSDDVKRRRFQVMQDLGQPPTELVGDISAPPEGFVAPPGQDASSCSLM